MSDQTTRNTQGASKDAEKRPDLDGEEWRDGAYHKPISTREYFKLLGYCMVGLMVVGVSISLFFGFLR